MMYLNDHINQYKAEYQTAVDTCRQNCLNAIEAYRADRRGVLEKAVCVPMSSEMKNKLSELRLRKNISADELKVIATEFKSCYSAMASLDEICREHGVYIEHADFSNLLREVDECCDMLKTIYSKPPEDFENNYLAFQLEGNYPLEEIFLAGFSHLDHLDTEISVKEIERTLTEGEKEMLDRMFRYGTPPDLPAQVRAAAESPELRRLIELSDYGQFLQADAITGEPLAQTE